MPADTSVPWAMLIVYYTELAHLPKTSSTDSVASHPPLATSGAQLAGLSLWNGRRWLTMICWCWETPSASSSTRRKAVDRFVPCIAFLNFLRFLSCFVRASITMSMYRINRAQNTYIILLLITTQLGHSLRTSLKIGKFSWICITCHNDNSLYNNSALF